jgi:hypothetical protein
VLDSKSGPKSQDTAIGRHAIHTSFFADQRAFEIFRAEPTLPELAELIGGKTAAGKALLPWIKLARFGDKRSRGGSLRNDANVRAISGIEVEHDACTVPFEVAVATMKQSKIHSLIYTSPSWVEGVKEKWRILLPLSKEHEPQARAGLVARVNGLFGGAITNECFVLSQAFYFGHVGDAAHREAVIDGDFFIDLRGDLVAGAIGKRTGDGVGAGETEEGHHHGRIAVGRSDDQILSLVQQSCELNRFGDRQWHNNMLEATASMVGQGWTDDEIYTATADFCDRGYGDEDIEVMIRGAREKWGVPDPAEELSARLGADVCKLLERDRGEAGVKAGASSAADAWDPWRETPAPRLDHALLPAAVREAAAISAQASGADIDAFAVAYLTGLAACCDTRLRITPKQHATDWSVPLLLWVMLLAAPASMKSEIIKSARALPAGLDMEERERHQRDLATAEIGVMVNSGTKAALKKARDAVKPPRQRVCGDITIEKYVNVLSTNPGGCASFRDELSGWLGSFGRYTAKGADAADRAFYCALRDGSPYDRQRVTSDDVHVEHCAGSFLGAVQPDRLVEMKNLPTADGLLQRFMPVIMREARGYEDSSGAGDAKALLRPVRDRLAALAPEMQADPYGRLVARPYKLTPEGAELYRAFADDMRVAGRAGEPSREFAECLNKMGPMWLSLALLFHLIEAPGTPAAAVPVETARRADAMLRGFFIPHAEVFYDMLCGGAHQMRSIATAILRCPDQIMLTHVVRHCRAVRGLERDGQVKLMQRFETAGWLVRVDRYGNTRPLWRRTPGLTERFKDELKREEEARAAMRATIADTAGKRGGTDRR